MNLFSYSEDRWTTHSLNDHVVALDISGAVGTNSPEESPVVLIPDGRNCLLLASDEDSVTVNGHRISLRIVKLAHRDEIVTRSGARLFVSSETLEKPEPFPGLDAGPCHCPRCRLVIETGAMAVRCGGCGLWEHKACWSYAPTCAACPRATDPEAGPTFNPGDL